MGSLTIPLYLIGRPLAALVRKTQKDTVIFCLRDLRRQKPQSLRDNNNDFAVTDVTIVDKLPEEIIFVSADDDGVNGFYDYDDKSKTQSYIWTYEELPPRTSTLLELTVQAHPDIDAGTIITNTVTINSNETAPTTTSGA